MTETTLHPKVKHVADTLAAKGLTDRVRVSEQRVATAAEAAEQLGCPVGAIANSLIFDAEGEPVLILASGAHRVDTERAAGALGVARLRRASADFVRQATGQPIGGVSPVGHPSPLRTLVDEALREYTVVHAAAGHPNATFPTTFDELVTLTGGTPAEIGD